ncbi:TIGR03619 family F420-dependent LLM class oxidoreductase [Actinoplanes bogorensis]|uniref:TIGR03619 family F420-dependent LLM class oxidoreductase n=1 Tax=Paractinoplanes bogorensis TaxID=1610840 RepID=A0ABS5YHV7_9ACTN|nr:TIGR03619 family F420-dependent LLM class oxidoreductase [Actinoplanes bogorensis]MBU2662616.1 TIGR03619 family F420-dependent LLM class oxidoreductase [Actinoplanes bogorensis]
MLISCGAPVAGAWAEPGSLGDFAARAEELGYHGLWGFQRLLVGTGQAMLPVYQSVLDPLLALTWAAARTRTIRLGVAVINIPYVSPAYLAKQAATLDVLSGGRFDLGLGTGWSEPEFVATGSDPHPRGKRLHEYLEVLRTLWNDPVASFDGELYRLPASTMAPPPVQPGGPPVLLGGTADVALRRAGRLAAGWVSSSRLSFADIARGTQIVRRAAEEAGRDPDSVRIVVRAVVQPGLRDDAVPLSGDWEQIRAGAEQYAEAGVTELFYDLNWDPLIGSPDADPAVARERAAEILTALRPPSNHP